LNSKGIFDHTTLKYRLFKCYNHRLKWIWRSDPNYEKFKKSLKKSPPNISPHSNFPLDFWGVEFWRDIRCTFFKIFFEFLIIWIRSSNLFETMVITLTDFSINWYRSKLANTDFLNLIFGGQCMYNLNFIEITKLAFLRFTLNVQTSHRTFESNLISIL
jgi:hypothetical protein